MYKDEKEAADREFGLVMRNQKADRGVLIFGSNKKILKSTTYRYIEAITCEWNSFGDYRLKREFLRYISGGIIILRDRQKKRLKASISRS